MLDMVVLVAIAVTAAAFAAGLIFQAGLPLIPAAIAAVAFYLAMAASYIVVARSSRAGSDSFRLDEIEGALENIGSDLQRIERIEGGHARIEQLASDLQSMHARIEGLRADLEVENRSQREKISDDLGMLEALIKQLSQDLTAPGAAAAASALAPSIAEHMRSSAAEIDMAEPEIGIGREDVSLTDEEIESVVAAVAEIMEGGDSVEVETETLTVTGGDGVEVVETETTISLAEAVESASPADVPGAADSPADAVRHGVLDVLQQAIDAGRVDLYLDPIVALPQRKTRYYAAGTRIRNAADEVIEASAYLPVAESAGILQLIDNVLLVKSVQALRSRGPESKLKGIFCNVSIQSLLDPEFFPELVEFLEENSGLSDSLLFELRQADIAGLTRSELGSLDTLGALGFQFALTHIGDLDVDFIELNDRYFRFLKIDAPTFLYGLQDKGALLPPGEMLRYLEGFGLQVVVEKVEDENAVKRLVNLGVELAQGPFFGEPKPMSQSLFRELEDADVA